MAKKPKYLFKSYLLQHHSNPNKVDSLFQLYSVYQSQFKYLIHNYWSLFLNNKIDNNKFSHLGSTKHIKTKLNASYTQICLSQVCALLNNYNSNIALKFTEFINNSTIKDKDTLHKLRSINSNYSWLNKYPTYFPELTRNIVDDFGNLISIKYKQETLIDNNTKRLAKLIFNHIVNKNRVNFPNIKKPRLLLDSRVFELDKSNSKSFDYWLKITTLEKGNRVLIPIKSNKFFDKSSGIIGNTIELNFNHLDYPITQFKHNSLSKPKVNNKYKNHKSKFKNKGLVKSNKVVKIIFNKKTEIKQPEKLAYQPTTIPLTRTVAFDLGLSNLIATDNGNLLGRYWLSKLTRYDKKLNDLFSARQSCISKFNNKIDKNNKNKSLKLKIRSKRYDKLIGQVRGFIKTEINRILNNYFKNNVGIKTVVIEKLKFSNPNLSRRLNRIIQNFGFKLYKDKLEELSIKLGFNIEELNPAYTSQQCYHCGYVDKNNRTTQAEFKCKCCGLEINADVQGSRNNLKRFKSEQVSAYKTKYKSNILYKIKLDFVKEIKPLLINGTIGRRNLYNLLNDNDYYGSDMKFVRTTKAQGVEPMTVLNFEEYLSKYYDSLK